MKFGVILMCLLVLWPAMAVGQLNQPVETNWEGVTARLVMCQQDLYRMAVVMEWHNTTDKSVSGGRALYFKDIHLYDPHNDKKYFVLRDASGAYLAGPRSDANDGGRWWIKLPPGEKVRSWASFAAVPSSTQTVDVVIPQLTPFESIPVVTQPFPQETEHAGVYSAWQVALVSAQRRPGAVTVRLRLSNVGSATVDAGAIYYRDAYLYDYRNQRKYPVLKDAEEQFLAEPKSDKNDGGRWWISALKPGARQLMSLNFQAPPDSVSDACVVVPLLVPFNRVALPGTSGVDKTGGLEVVGAESALDRVLADLKADETATELKLVLDAAILFDHDKADIRPNAEAALLSALTVIEEYAPSKIRIEGHTDSMGEAEYNMALSERRARAVRDWLVAHGCAPERLTTAGFGESRPVATNDTEPGRQQNRQVELIIEK